MKYKIIGTLIVALIVTVLFILVSAARSSSAPNADQQQYEAQP